MNLLNVLHLFYIEIGLLILSILFAEHILTQVEM